MKIKSPFDYSGFWLSAMVIFTLALLATIYGYWRINS